MTWPRRLHMLAAAMVVALVVAAPATAGSDEQNRSAAVADAASLLSAAPLPDGATPLAAEPGDDGGTLASPPTFLSGARLVTRTAFFRVDQSEPDLLSFVSAHAPARATPALSGSAESRDGRSYEFRGFQRAPVAGVLAVRSLTVTVSKLDQGGTGIRVDAQVVWIKPRPAAETIPASAHYLAITSRGRGVPVTTAKRVQRLAGFLNRLDIVQPMQTRACPLYLTNAPTPRLVFRSRRGGHVLATAIVRSGGCGSVEMNVGGRTMPALDLVGPAADQLLAALKSLGAL